MGTRLAAGRLLYLAKASISYVELDDDVLIARMGWFRARLHRSDIGVIERQPWEWYWFSGWRFFWATGYVVLGAPGDVVYLEIRRPPLTFAAVFPTRVRRLYLGVVDVHGVRAAIHRWARS